MKAYDMIMFFYNKDEHYPISDKFIEQYQQLSGGYLDYALKTGHCINRSLHEPNQKWHLLESWFLQTVAEKEETSLEKINTKGFKCPELLLWMAEAAGVEEEYINKASDYAAEKIDEIRREDPKSKYSAKSVSYLNNKMKENYNQTFWDMIVEKVKIERDNK